MLKPASPASPERFQSDQLITKYLAFLRCRRLSELTISARETDLCKFVQFQTEFYPTRSALDLDVHAIRHGVAWLRTLGLADRSMLRVLSSWRGWYRYLLSEYSVSGGNPVSDIRIKARKTTLPGFLSLSQTERLLNVNPSNDLEVRDHAMAELLYGCGLRVSELVGIEVNGRFCIRDGAVTVVGKGKKVRSVPVGRAAQRALENWLALRSRYAQRSEKALFVSHRTGRRLSQRAVRSRLQRFASLSGLEIRVHPHMLRHSFATHLLQSSGNLLAVQELLGHKTVRSTQVYTHVDVRSLTEVYDRTHPRSRFGLQGRADCSAPKPLAA